MKRTLVMMASLAGAMTISVVAQQVAPAERSAQLENEFRKLVEVTTKARGLLETRVTRGQPYSADAVTEFIQVLSDGNRIVRRTTVRLARDSDGRTRRETLTSGASEPSSVVINDPVARLSYVLDPEKKTAAKAPTMFAVASGGMYSVNIARGRGGSGDSETVTLAPAQERRAAETKAEQSAAFTATGFAYFTELGKSERRETTKESLGQQMVEGVMATGTRSTTTIPAGAIGNEQPLATVSEQWFSDELEVLVLTKHNDPRSGETTYRLSNLQRAEPDRSLFQVPAHYAVTEPRKRFFDWQQQ